MTWRKMHDGHVSEGMALDVRRLCREERRARLTTAFETDDFATVFGYAVSRSISKTVTEMACYGTAMYDQQVLAQRAARWALRLWKMNRRRKR